MEGKFARYSTCVLAKLEMSERGSAAATRARNARNFNGVQLLTVFLHVIPPTECYRSSACQFAPVATEPPISCVGTWVAGNLHPSSGRHSDSADLQPYDQESASWKISLHVSPKGA